MKIALLGDIAFFGRYSMVNDPKVMKRFVGLRPILESADIVIGNLETPLTSLTHTRVSKSAHIKAEPVNVEVLKELGIGYVSLANNHLFDYGTKGFQETKNILCRHGIAYFGVEGKTCEIEHNGNKIMLSGYCCYSANGAGMYAHPNRGINILNAHQVEQDLQRYHNEGYFNISSWHMGQEHVHMPNYDHVLVARKMSKKVPFVLHGHHPHVIQGIEYVDNSLLMYSMGNFCFDDVYTKRSKEPLVKQSKANKQSFIALLEVENNQLLSYQTIGIEDMGDHIEVVEGDQGVQEYSEFLGMAHNEYRLERSQRWNVHVTGRKKKRDVQWYLKRLNFNSIGILCAQWRNLKAYKKCIISYIDVAH